MATGQHLIGRTLSGRFRVMALLGEGAMASVYFGLDLEASPPIKVAVKVMHPHLSTDKTFLSRFLREAKAAQKLEHPSTVKVLSHGEDGGVVYMVMELLEGRDLFDTLAAEGTMSQARALTILRQVADALTAAHASGIIHRDLKPENIMLVGDGDPPLVKVLDFGIAKLGQPDRGEDAPPSSAATSSAPSSALTVVGMVLGTPHYMSPEQARADPIDARSDLYACGVILFQLVTGRLPFEGQTPVEIALAQLQGKAHSPSELAPDLHPSVVTLITKAMMPWPAQRQQTARELRDEIDLALAAVGAAREAPLAVSHATGPSDHLDPEEPAPETRRSLIAPAPTEPAPPIYLALEQPPEHESAARTALIIVATGLLGLVALAAFLLVFMFL